MKNAPFTTPEKKKKWWPIVKYSLGGLLLLSGLMTLFSEPFPHNVIGLSMLWIGSLLVFWKYVIPKNTKQKLLKHGVSWGLLVLFFVLGGVVTDSEPTITLSDFPSTTEKSSFDLSFNVENTKTLKINGEIEPISESGEILKTIQLKPRANSIDIVAIAEDGYEAKKNISVYHVTEDEKKALEAEKLAKAKEEAEQKEKEQQDEDGDVAAICAQNWVERNLKSPSSAKFPWGLQAAPQGDRKFFVRNYVDAQNAFGAMIRTYYRCNVQVVDADNFLCDTSCEFE